MKLLDIPKPALNIGLFTRKKISLGIQYSEQFLKLSYLEKKGQDFTLPVMPFQITIPSTDIEEAGYLLKEEMEKREIKASSVVVGLPLNSVLFRTIQLPKVEKKELEDAIEYNIREDLKSIKGSTIYDYSVLSEDEGNILNILVVIAHMKHIENINDILKAAGLEIDIIDTQPTTLVNLALHLQEKKEEKEENICIVHIDDDESYIVFFHKSLIVQSLNFNSTKYEDLSPEKKESAVEGLINEINYFFLTIHEPKNIYLSGNTFKFPEIKAYSQLKFGTRFNLEDLDPALALDLKYEGNLPLGIYNIPISLAYRGFEEWLK